MEKTWGRRHEFVALEPTTLSLMLQPLFPGKQLTSAELLTSGHCNTNYKIQLSGLDDTFVLRIYVRDHAACQKDLDIFNLVRAHVPFPAILYADPYCSHYDYPYAIMKWVDGALLNDVLSTNAVPDIAACAYEVGATLAHIGTYTFPQAGFFGPGLTIAQPFDDDSTSFPSLIHHFLFEGKAHERLGPALTDRLWTFVTNNTAYLAEIEETPCLVHSDYKPINILVRQHSDRWQVAAVLDWEFAFSSSHLTDIANMLRYNHVLPPTFESQFIQGFLDHGGSLPPNWQKIIKLIDLISLLEFLNIPAQRDALFEDVKGLITSTLERWGDSP